MNSIQDSFIEEATEILDELKDCLRNYHSLNDANAMLSTCLQNFKLLIPSSKLMKMFVFYGHVKLLVTKLEESINDNSVELHMDFFNTTIKASELALAAKEFGVHEARETSSDVDRERFMICLDPVVFIGIDKEKVSEITKSLKLTDNYFIFNDISSFLQLQRETPNEIIIIEKSLLSEAKNSDREFNEYKTIVYGSPEQGYYNYDGTSTSSLVVTYEMMRSIREYEYFSKKSLSLILYQLSDIEDFLIEKDDIITLDIMKKEIKDLLLANERLVGELD